jgi:hypothetical protein
LSQQFVLALLCQSLSASLDTVVHICIANTACLKLLLVCLCMHRSTGIHGTGHCVIERRQERKEKLPSEAKLLEHLVAVKGQLFGDEARAAGILRQLLNGPIRVVPYMRIDGKRVVPRLEFTINLVAALPAAVASPLRPAAAAEDEPPEMLNRPLVVNAFAEPQPVKHARVTLKRRLAGKTYKEIAKNWN